MSLINIHNIRQMEGLMENLQDLRNKIEQRINLNQYSTEKKQITLNNSKLMRICLIAGLTSKEERKTEDFKNIQLSPNRIFETLFTHHDLTNLVVALLKIRYNQLNLEWKNDPENSRIINAEILRGKEVLLKEGALDEWLLNTYSPFKGNKSQAIPFLNLNIGTYEDDIQASLNLNGRDIANTQILIAGTTGSGKSNLLAVLLNEIRTLSIESPYPVNFLLFDYKGEFSDIANNSWLNLFEINRGAILDPITKPLPFTPFKDFTGRTQNEINLYSTELSLALCSIDRATISANMSNRLSEAIINAYKRTNNNPVTFDIIIK